MTKKNSVLQKKLLELESELNYAFSLPPESPYHDLLSHDIHQKFIFLHNLLSAELSSRPKKPHHVRHIAQQLDELETAFGRWVDFRSANVDHVEVGSTCSCTESCLNEEEEEKVVEEKAQKEVVVVEEEGGRGWGRGFLGGEYTIGLVIGVVIGAVMVGCTMVRFCGSFYDGVELRGFVVPT